MKKSLISIILFLLSLGFIAQAVTITVCSTGCDYTTIQEAINNASDGDIIQVGSGTYREQLYINKSLILIGTNATIEMPDNITSYTWNTVVKPLVAIDTSNVNMSGFKLVDREHNTTGFHGIHYWKSSGKIENCEISGFYVSIVVNHVWDVNYPTHIDIFNNTIYGYTRNGMACNEIGTDVSIIDNFVDGLLDETYSSNGIQIGYGASGEVIGNRVYNNTYPPSPWDAVGVLIAGGVDGTYIINNTVENNDAGIFLYNDVTYGYGGVTNTTIVGNDVSNSIYGVVVEKDCLETEMHFNRITNSSSYNVISNTSFNGTYNWWGSTTPNISKFLNVTYYPFCLNSDCSIDIEEQISEFSGNTTDFSTITDWSNVNLTLDEPDGTISWIGLNLTGCSLKFSDAIEISYRKISIDTSQMPEIDKPATLTFKKTGYTRTGQFDIYRNRVLCPSSICTGVSVSNGNVIVTVTGLSEYELRDRIIQTTKTVGGVLLGVSALSILFTLAFSPEDPRERLRYLIYSLVGVIILIVAIGVLIAM